MKWPPIVRLTGAFFSLASPLGMPAQLVPPLETPPQPKNEPVIPALRGNTPAPATPTATGHPLRAWKLGAGQPFLAMLVGAQAGQITLRLPQGQSSAWPLARFSPSDQAYLRGLFPALPAPPPALMATPVPVRLPPEKRIWPQKVIVDPRSLEVTVVREDAAKREYIYHSGHFQFIAEDKLAGSVMKEIARTFEATHDLVQALPWGIDPKPPADLGYYQAKFYLNQDNYLADGGPPNSGGVYFAQDRMFRVPFESLGLEMRGKTWFKQPGYTGDTLIHEITHQMMHDVLPFLPLWLAEGTAEYTSLLSYNAGTFTPAQHEHAMRGYLKKAVTRDAILGRFTDPLAHMSMTPQQWHSSTEAGDLYFRSAVLVYFFSHLDGDGRGTRLSHYFDKIAAAHAVRAAFFKNPRVKLLPSGTFTYPADLPFPPEADASAYGLAQLPILLEGRTGEKLKQEMTEAFKKAGLK